MIGGCMMANKQLEDKRAMNRRLSLIQSYQEFCKRHNLSYRIPGNDESPTYSLISSLETLILKNEFKRNIDRIDGVAYIKVDIYFEDKHILSGYFTTSEIDDISNTATLLRLE